MPLRLLLLSAALLLVGCVDGAASDDGERGNPGDAVNAGDAVVVEVSDTALVDSSAPETTVAVDSAVADVADASPHVCPAASAPKDCSVGPGKGTADECHDAPSCYLKTVQKAVNGLVSAHPDWFDFTGPSGCPVIKNVDQFLNAVVANVSADGLCIVRDPNAPGEEVTVKKDNAFSENFDIVSSAGCARSGDPIYTGYCAPAWW